MILFKQTLKDVENLYRDIAGFDMSYEEFKKLCKESWLDEYNYLKIDRQNNKNERYTVYVMNLVIHLEFIYQKLIHFKPKIFNFQEKNIFFSKLGCIL